MQKKDTISNPVLHFGSDVARDLVRDRVIGHFHKACKHMESGKKEIHLGMLEAMKNDRQPGDIKDWLLTTEFKTNIAKVNNLISRYAQIFDNELRHEAFISGKEDFWEASYVPPQPTSSEAYRTSLIHRIVICLERQKIDNETCFAEIARHRIEYHRANHG
jgi:hypothetical protein